jgi:glyoxylase-like metal-dependent hydrolase (beta-lactamase superfamily II)
MPEKAAAITPEIFQIGGPGFTDANDAAVYLIASAGKAAMVDAGAGRSVDQLLANAQACGVAPDRITDLLLTHCHFDHTGGAAELQARLGVRVVMHALDAPYVETGDAAVTAAAWYGDELRPFQPDWIIAETPQALTIGVLTIQAIHVPGHSPGSLVYVTVSDGHNVLFGQDVHGPLHPSLKSDAAAYRQSLQAMIALEADILCEGHFGIIEGRDRVQAFIRRYL